MLSACRFLQGLPNPLQGFSGYRRKSAPRTSARESWLRRPAWKPRWSARARWIARKPQLRARSDQRKAKNEGISYFLLLMGQGSLSASFVGGESDGNESRRVVYCYT